MKVTLNNIIKILFLSGWKAFQHWISNTSNKIGRIADQPIILPIPSPPLHNSIGLET